MRNGTQARVGSHNNGSQRPDNEQSQYVWLQVLDVNSY